MNIKLFLAAGSLCLLPLCSQAGVVYQWTSTNDGTPEGITLKMEFDKRTVRQGSFTLDFRAENADYQAPKRGLLSLRYTHPWQSELMNYSAKKRGFDHEMGWLYMDVTFDEGGFLSGVIEANDQFQDFRMISTGPEFTIVRADDDGGMRGCGWVHEDRLECGGATGYIERVAEVPEPISLAIFALGAAGLGGIARRHKAIK